MEKILSLIWTIKHKIILNTKFVPNLGTKERMSSIMDDLQKQLYRKISDEWKIFIDTVILSSAETIVETAYEMSAKENIKNYISKERLNLSSKQFHALLSVPDCLSELYNGWASDEHISTYSDVTKLLTTVSDKIIMTTSDENLVVY